MNGRCFFHNIKCKIYSELISVRVSGVIPGDNGELHKGSRRLCNGSGLYFSLKWECWWETQMSTGLHIDSECRNYKNTICLINSIEDIKR